MKLLFRVKLERVRSFQFLSYNGVPLYFSSILKSSSQNTDVYTKGLCNMLARSMLKVYVPRAERKALYKDKVPGITARLYAAQLIAKNIGLIKRDVFGITSGIFFREYRKNLTILKLISHALFQLEMDGWIKVYNGRIYIIKEKSLPYTGLSEKHNVFGVIAETVKEIATIFEGEFSKKSADQICDACKPLFCTVESLSEARIHETARPDKDNRHGYMPFITGAAKDIAAGGHFYNGNKAVFEKKTVEFIIKTGKPETDKARETEALAFDQFLDSHAQSAKELSGADLRSEFSLRPADRSTPFPGKAEFDFLSQVVDVFKLSRGEDLSDLKALSSFEPGEVGQAEAYFLHKLLLIVRGQFRKGLEQIHIENLPEALDFLSREFLSEARESMPELLEKFQAQTETKDFLDFIRRTSPIRITEFEESFRLGAMKLVGDFFAGIVDGITDKMMQAQPYDITYIISDLHLQDFVHRDIYELLRLLHMVKATGGTLIINGDTLDTWRAKRLFTIMKANKPIFDALGQLKRVLIIKGNHDGWLELFRGMRVFSDRVSIVDRFYADNLHIEHGNFYDVFNSEASWLGKAATRVVTKAERNEIIGPQLLAWTEYVGRRVIPKTIWTRQKVDRVFKGIKDVYNKRDPEGTRFNAENPLNIVFGHYHFPGLFHAYDKINKKISNDPELSEKIRFFLTDSWNNSEGYAGQVTVFAKKKTQGTGQLLTNTWLWEYIDAMKILTLYGTWKF